MNLQWSYIVIPLGVGVVTGLTTKATTWTDLRQPLLTAIAIISAGILVRLSRGVPFSAIEVLEADEARKLAEAIKLSVRALRALLIICFLTIFFIVFSVQIADLLATPVAQNNLPFTEFFDYLGFLVPALLVFVCMRTYAVVEGDVQIADIQADILVKKRGTEDAKGFRTNIAQPTKESFRQPKGYGGVIEGDSA